MKASKILMSLIGSLACLWGCDEVVEKDIRKEKVVLTSPADRSVLKDITQTFKWEALKGARNYRLEVVSPTFENPAKYYVDSTMGRTTFTFALDQGSSYQWRVKGINNGYVTDSVQIRTFRIDSLKNLSDQTLSLVKPLKDTYFNITPITFQWKHIELAEKYNVIIRSGSSTILDTLISAPVSEFRRNFPTGDKSYQWEVVAMKLTKPASVVSSGESQFTIDKTPPPAPSLVSPSDTLTRTLPITLKWKRNSIDVSKDIVFLYKSDNSTLVTDPPSQVTSETFSVDGLAAGEYYWAISSVDKAGNEGPKSGKRKFTYQK